jgi:ABC-type sugar transport system ATPase subunit
VVLAGIDLHVPAGSVFALLGPNGAGKTTTVRILTTLSRPDAGQVMVAGYDVVREPAKVRAAISLTGQHSAVDNEQTGRENLVMAGRLMHLGAEHVVRQRHPCRPRDLPSAHPRRRLHDAHRNPCPPRSSRMTTHTGFGNGVSDSLTMIGRSIRLSRRNIDTLVMSIMLPLMIMALFVYVFGGAIHTGTNRGVGDRAELLHVVPALPEQRVRPNGHHAVVPARDQ